MIAIDPHYVEQSGKRLINIRDGSRKYETAFWIEDGKQLTVVTPEGRSVTSKCSYIDPYHFNFGSTCYHIDQFADKIYRSMLRCFPEEYVTDLSLYKKQYFDRDLKDSNGKIIPYRAIIGLDYSFRQPSPKKVIGICPEAAYDRQVAFSEYVNNGSKTTFCSIPEALTNLVPSLELPAHERKLLSAVLEENNKAIVHISQKDFDALPNDYKGFYEDFDGKHPEWKGKRVAFLPGHGTNLFIEGLSFVIDPYRKPSLNKQVDSAAAKTDPLYKQSKPITLNHDR